MPINFKYMDTVYGLTKQGFIGALNTVVSLAVFNGLIFATGLASGWPVTLFTLAAYAAGITHSFMWSKYWIFKHAGSGRGPTEYLRFFIIATSTAILGSLFVYVLTTHVRAPYSLSAELWANIAILLFFPVSLLSTYFGSKRFVFKRPTS